MSQDKMMAIVNSGNRRLVGMVPDGAVPNTVVTVEKAYELRCDMFMVMTQNGPIGLHKNTMVPVDAEEDAVDVTVAIDNVRFFNDMPDRGRKYDAMIQEIQEQMIQNRANKEGLTIARKVPPPPKSGLIL
jgi:hypothetical protein